MNLSCTDQYKSRYIHIAPTHGLLKQPLHDIGEMGLAYVLESGQQLHQNCPWTSMDVHQFMWICMGLHILEPYFG